MMMTPRPTHQVLPSICVAAALLALAALALACEGSGLAPDGLAVDATDAPCTDPARCCPAEKLRCEGDPDTGVVCTCSDLWTCSKDQSKCEQPAPTPGGSGWTCSWSAQDYRCERQGSKGAPPSGGAAWSCDFDELKAAWICTRLQLPNPTNQPGGTSSWSCQVEQGKLVCTRKTKPAPTPPTPPATTPPAPPAVWPKPQPGKECVPGQKKWCDGELYCGWGQVECTTQGKWKRDASGELKCLERADGRVPNTTCACYYFFFDDTCCETPDCIVPKGTSGQLCPKSPGKLCDYCNPHKPECLSGGMCVVSMDETFCGRDCSAAKPCPAGYGCMLLLQKLKLVHQCVPSDGSCYQ